MDYTTIIIQSCALMLALIILRPLLKRFVSPRARCALWAIPAARLLLPFELRSPLSLMAPAQDISHNISAVVAQPVAPPVAWTGTAVTPPAVTATAAPVQTAPALPTVAEVPAAEPTLSIGTILLMLWAIGFAVTAGLIIYQNVRFRLRIKKLAVAFGERDGIPIYLVPELPSPCLAGIFRPRIYINRRALSSDEVLDMTLRHELCHLRRLDHVWCVLRGVLLAVHWYNPLVWLSSEFFRADSETACDAAVTRDMDKTERESYGMALIDLASRSGSSRLTCLSTMNGSKKLLRERISQLARSRHARSAAVIAVAVAAVLCFTMCTSPSAGTAVEPEEPPVETSTPTAAPTPIPTPTPVPTAASTPELTVEPGNQPVSGTEHGSLEYFVSYLEANAHGMDFSDMDKREMESYLEPYGDLLKGYTFVGRENSTGAAKYIIGQYRGEEDDNKLIKCQSADYSTDTGFSKYYYLPEISAEMDKYLSDLSMGHPQAEMPEGAVYVNTSSCDYYTKDGVTTVIIAPSGNIYDVWSNFRLLYRNNGKAYILDAASRGVWTNEPEAPYAAVSLIHPIIGETTEYIPLTELDLQAIAESETVDISAEKMGFACVIRHGGGENDYYINGQVPQYLIDLAEERCGYMFESPDDMGRIVSATLECPWLDAPRTVDAADLGQLEGMLRNAEYGYMGACGYDARLILDFSDGRSMTVYKGCDGCDSIAFGSWGGYFLGDWENQRFWEIFGLDWEYSHQPLEQ